MGWGLIMKVEVSGTFVEVPDELSETFNDMTPLEQGASLCKLMGMSNRDAYYAGGGASTNIKSADACAARLLGSARCRKFIRGCQDLRFTTQIMSRDEMAARLSLIARTQVGDVIDYNETNETFIDSVTGLEVAAQTVWSLKPQSEMSGAGLAAITELTASKEGFKFKMHDQKAAMKQLATLLGYDKPQQVQMSIGKSLDDLYDAFEADEG